MRHGVFAATVSSYFKSQSSKMYLTLSRGIVTLKVLAFRPVFGVKNPFSEFEIFEYMSLPPFEVSESVPFEGLKCFPLGCLKTTDVHCGSLGFEF